MFEKIIKSSKKRINLTIILAFFLIQEIDQMVYQLYGLTEDEIRIVEGGK